MLNLKTVIVLVTLHLRTTKVLIEILSFILIMNHEVVEYLEFNDSPVGYGISEFNYLPVFELVYFVFKQSGTNFYWIPEG